MAEAIFREGEDSTSNNNSLTNSLKLTKTLLRDDNDTVLIIVKSKRTQLTTSSVVPRLSSFNNEENWLFDGYHKGLLWFYEECENQNCF